MKTNKAEFYRVVHAGTMKIHSKHISFEQAKEAATLQALATGYDQHIYCGGEYRSVVRSYLTPAETGR